MAKRRKSIPVLQDGNIVNVVKREEEVAADTDWGVEGFLDVVSEIEGVAGWARYAERPGMRPEVEILLDGVLAGVVTADTFRPDLLAAGLGDGAYGFSMALPFHALNASREVIVTARDRRSGNILPQPLVFRQNSVADALTRIAELENDLRLLASTIAALEQRGGQDECAAKAIFKTVGDFFQSLADGPLTPASGLAAANVLTLSEDPKLIFELYDAPVFTIFVEAAENVSVTRETLRVLGGTLGDLKVEIVLLDSSTREDVSALLVGIRNLPYARLPAPSAVNRTNEAMQLARGEIVVFLSPGAQPQQGWARALAAFERQPNLAALVPEDTDARPAFALRRAVWERLGGLDEAFNTPDAALAEYTLRAKNIGYTVEDAPEFSVLPGQAIVEGISEAALTADAQRLREAGANLRLAAE